MCGMAAFYCVFHRCMPPLLILSAAATVSSPTIHNNRHAFNISGYMQPQHLSHTFARPNPSPGDVMQTHAFARPRDIFR